MLGRWADAIGCEDLRFSVRGRRKVWVFGGVDSSKSPHKLLRVLEEVVC
jgi:hypothetical protein